MKIIPCVLLLALCSARAEDSRTQAYSAYGWLIVTQFVTAPFPHPSRAEGHNYKDKFFPADKHYHDSTVAIFIPKDFRATGVVDVVVHFHGWGNSVAGSLKQFKLIEQFAESRRNAILVLPEGPREASDSAGGKLEDPDGFARFIAELTATLRAPAGPAMTNVTVDHVILSGHSGGYRVMAAILDRGGMTSRIREVWLFDALYAEADKFLAWTDRQSGRLLNIYTDGGGTKDDVEAMMELLKKRGAKLFAGEDSTVKPEELKRNKLIFLHTDLGHNDVLARRATFESFLKTSCLGEIVTPGSGSKKSNGESENKTHAGK